MDRRNLLRLLQHRHQIVGGMLPVDIDVVATAETERLGGDRAAQLRAQADLLEVHDGTSLSRRRATAVAAGGRVQAR